jgi:hypothetical protein
MWTVENFSGVWKRTLLYEPIGTVGPEEEQLKDVIWVQSKDGYFIDIRYQSGTIQHDKMKSFAGTGSFDANKTYFTWTRLFDFRTPGTPDIGLMRVLKGTQNDPEQLEEDGVLPGDDYREIWDLLSAPRLATDCTAKLRQVDASGRVTREGLFLVVGDWFALTISRSGRDDSASVLQTAFSSSDTSATVMNNNAEDSTYVWSYVAVMGSSSTWEVTHSLHPQLRGRTFGPDLAAACAGPEAGVAAAAADTLKGVFSATGGDWQWEFVSGQAPQHLAPYIV